MEWKITDGSFKGYRFHVASPKSSTPRGVTDQEITKERRLQISERAQVDGGDVEDFGRKPITYNATVIFFGDDYRNELKKFEDILNEGTSGTLILPDEDEAVNAKFQRLSRRSNANDGFSTVLTVSWIEDRSIVVTASNFRNLQDAQEALQTGNTQEGIPTVLDQAAKVQANADKALSTLNNNPFVKSLEAAEGAVTNVRLRINSALTVGRNARQNILNNVARIRTEINGLKSAVNGLKNFTDLLNFALIETNPSRINVGLGAQDFKLADTVSTTIVEGTAKVVVQKEETVPVQSFKEAEGLLQASSVQLGASQSDLENQTEGTTDDYNEASTVLINSIRDLIFVIREKPTSQVMTTTQTSLMEVCFNNDIDVTEIDRIYRLNTHISDILDIAPLTLVNL